jgi:hypothetical protein
VPKTRIAGSMHVPAEGGTEPLGRRIIEMPEDLRRTEQARRRVRVRRLRAGG